MTAAATLTSLPTDWGWASIADTCGRPEYGHTASAVVEHVGPKFLRITDIQATGVSWNQVPYCECSESASSRLSLRSGDLLVARIGATTGKTYLVRECPDAVFASYLIRLRAKTVDPGFLYYFTRSQLYWSQVDAHKGDKLKGGISGSVLTTIKHPFPPAVEQRAIARVLSELESRVLLEHRCVAGLRELKAATTAKLFREGLQAGGARESKIGGIPAGWEIVRVADLGTLVTGTTPPTGEAASYGGEIPFIAPGDLGGRRIVTVSQKTLTERGAVVSRPLPAQSTMVVCIGATIGKVGMTGAQRSCTNQQINSIVPSDGMDPEFVHYLMEWSSPRLKPLSNPGPVPILSKSVFGQIEVAIPRDPDERREIGRVLGPIDAAAEASATKLDALRECFDALLQSLMTGTIRVPEHGYA